LNAAVGYITPRSPFCIAMESISMQKDDRA
jgi:hypothetical protein